MTVEIYHYSSSLRSRAALFKEGAWLIIHWIVYVYKSTKHTFLNEISSTRSLVVTSYNA